MIATSIRWILVTGIATSCHMRLCFVREKAAFMFETGVEFMDGLGH